MKKVLFAVCSLCIAASAAASPLSAFAADISEETNYPEIFHDRLTFNKIADFAIANDNLMVFADGNTIVHWQNENSTVFEFDTEVTDVDYGDGHFFYSLDGGTTSYILPDNPADSAVQTAHDFSAAHITQTSKDVGDNYIYYYNYDNELVAIDKNNTTPISKSLNLRNAKFYNIEDEDRVFAICDVLLYEIVGLDVQTVEIYHSNYDKLKNVSVGDTPEKLNTYGDLSENPKYVYIENGALITAVDLNLLAPYDIDGTPLPAPQYFPISNPKTQTWTNIYGAALLLCQTGNASVVSIGKQAYIMNSEGATPFTEVQKKPVDQGTTAAVNAVGEYAHSLPFVSNATRTFSLSPGETVAVLYEVSGENIAHRFYIVENANGERGYVAEEFLGDLNAPVPDESGASTIPDPDPHTDNYIRTVVLVIVIILLVLIAVGYLTWLSAFNKHKKPNEKNDGEIDINNMPDDDKKE